MPGRPAEVVSGPAGVRRFYDDGLQRRHAIPPLVKLVLFGKGALHGLDGDDHDQRKSLFVDILNAANVDDLALRADQQWQVTAGGWTKRDRVFLFDEVGPPQQRVLGQGKRCHPPIRTEL